MVETSPAPAKAERVPMRRLKVFLSAVLAGVCISLGGAVFLSTESKLAGALLFTVGLFTICAFGLHLFTGKVCYVFERGRAYALDLPVIWLGNLAGAALTALLLSLTRLTALTARAQEVCAAKLTDGLGSLFVLGVFCNVLIYIAVDGFAQCPHPLGKYLSLFFGVGVFILCGFEHCVADMFYFSMAGLWGWDTLLRLLVITAGNAVGAVVFPLCRRWLSRT